MKRTCFVLLALFSASALLARADQTTTSVQQALKDQGFYYGNITGQKNADTTAAIRRYQIRNGLQITGEIDAETLRSLGVGSSAGPAPATARAAESAAGRQRARTKAQGNPPRFRMAKNRPTPLPGPRPAIDTTCRRPRGLRPETSGVFDGTPYEIAPPDLQRHVIVGAQTLLARAGYYRSGIDGEFGPGTAEAVARFPAARGPPGGWPAEYGNAARRSACCRASIRRSFGSAAPAAAPAGLSRAVDSWSKSPTR